MAAILSRSQCVQPSSLAVSQDPTKYRIVRIEDTETPLSSIIKNEEAKCKLNGWLNATETQIQGVSNGVTSRLHFNITMTSRWASWRLKSPAIRWFIQQKCYVFSWHQRKHLSPRYQPFVRGIHRWSVDSPHKGPVTRKAFPLRDVMKKPSKCASGYRPHHAEFLLIYTDRLMSSWRLQMPCRQTCARQWATTMLTGCWPWWHMSRIVHLLLCITHDEVIKWKHFPRYWPFVRRIHRSPVNSPNKGQWRRALMFSLICARINAWVNNSKAGDLRRKHAHYDVTVMQSSRKHGLWEVGRSATHWFLCYYQDRLLMATARNGIYLTVFTAWMNNHTHYQVWDEITYIVQCSRWSLRMDMEFHPTFY